MFNTLEMTAITHNGFGQHNPLADRYEASAAFERALRRGKGWALRQKLLGRERGLRRLPKGGATTARRPAQQSAMVSIPLSQIVGSEGRVGDFDSDFNPRSLDQHRCRCWQRSLHAARGTDSGGRWLLRPRRPPSHLRGPRYRAGDHRGADRLRP